VNIIGNIKSQDATLADCMLELIWAHCEVNQVVLQDRDNADFAAHTHELVCPIPTSSLSKACDLIYITLLEPQGCTHYRSGHCKAIELGRGYSLKSCKGYQGVLPWTRTFCRWKSKQKELVGGSHSGISLSSSS